MGMARHGGAVGYFHNQQIRMMSHPSLNESFVSGTSGDYVEGIYEQWKSDPASVHKSWQVFGV